MLSIFIETIQSQHLTQCMQRNVMVSIKIESILLFSHIKTHINQ